MKALENSLQVTLWRCQVSNFKERKAILLNWLQQGNIIERCSEPGPSFGEFFGIDQCPITGVESLTNRLIREGQLKYETFHAIGMRIDRYIIVNVNGDNHE